MSEYINCDALTFAAATARLSLASIFLWSAVAKMRSSGAALELLATIGASGLRVPLKFVPFIEATLALALVADIGGALQAAAVLLTAFVVILAVAGLRGYRGGCGCFGDAATETLVFSAVRTGLLCVVTLLAIAGTASCPTAPTSLDAAGSSIAVFVVALGWSIAYFTLRLARGLPPLSPRAPSERF